MIHIFRPSKTSLSRGYASTTKFHPYKPHMLIAEALGGLEEYAVTVYDFHKADEVKRLTLAETMTRISMDQITTLGGALGEEIKKQRSLREMYE